MDFTSSVTSGLGPHSFEGAPLIGQGFGNDEQETASVVCEPLMSYGLNSAAENPAE
jgi:hypothetical protein